MNARYVTIVVLNRNAHSGWLAAHAFNTGNDQEREMKRSIFAAGLAAAVFGVAMTGCTGQIVQTAAGPMPDYCTSNFSNAAGGAVLGALLGTAIGAAAGGGRGAAFGALAGGAAGGLTGAQMDVNCRQYAMQNFMQMIAQQAVQRAAMAQARPVVSPAEYQSFEYYAPSPVEGQPPVRHRISQTGGYTNPATKVTCSPVTDFSFGTDGSSHLAGTRNFCYGPDGQQRPA